MFLPKRCNALFGRIALERNGRSFLPSSLFIRDDASWRTLAISFSSLLDLMDHLRARGKITAMRHRFSPGSDPRRIPRISQRGILAAKLRFAIQDPRLRTVRSFAAHKRTWRHCRQWIKRLQSSAGRSGIVRSDTANLWKLRLLQLPASAPGDDTQVYSVISCSNIWKILHDGDDKSQMCQ